MTEIQALEEFQDEFHVEHDRYPTPVELSNGMNLPIARRETIEACLESLGERHGERKHTTIQEGGGPMLGRHSTLTKLDSDNRRSEQKLQALYNNYNEVMNAVLTATEFGVDNHFRRMRGRQSAVQ